jgi:mono/diheme cytochrome c family protein
MADDGVPDNRSFIMNVLRWLVPILLLAACASEQAYDPLEDYEEVNATTIIDAPSAKPGSFAPADRDRIERGEYLVELLGCGSCHTDGALQGNPDMSRPLAGSRTGIAYTNPLSVKYPGVIYPANITPDEATGIGGWSDRQIANAIRAGIGRHGQARRIVTMPWQGYAKLSEQDLSSMIAYLRSLVPIRHQVPDEVAPGNRARDDFVYFGVYRSR